jgi:hypothetical protein
MAAAVFLEQVFHVFKKLHVATLVRRNGDPLCIFLNSTFYNLSYTAVMAKVNNFGAFALQNATHNVDGSIVTIEERSGGNNTDLFCGW